MPDGRPGEADGLPWQKFSSAQAQSQCLFLNPASGEIRPSAMWKIKAGDNTTRRQALGFYYTIHLYIDNPPAHG